MVIEFIDKDRDIQELCFNVCVSVEALAKEQYNINDFITNLVDDIDLYLTQNYTLTHRDFSIIIKGDGELLGI